MKNDYSAKIQDKYIDKFGDLPPIPMMISSGYDDPRYIKMLENALKTGKKVTIEDLNKWFPMKDDVDY
jgi:hypothetical protein